ncbi:hypothetical protein GLOTRDRAFT_138211 [Gloeophyllum trabeum ATCC 11539]|uniref:Fork-head domain-containing protein n=1 Tax=Gloeophyllum trabeum (strain ATCC 11539 / FP-39264 / Madison 617) TaxID=670483 RepID=S7QAZ8_GLOTA|nr:uncharacterized protein GLOTRDRAFT_138211 [Gloeophyllum trabeum ATCC 11539]EPQ56492.1 hypothetical protein GLOTRDRAFT_138211 [Gloeophyllum trabeum ATCC 11539]
MADPPSSEPDSQAHIFQILQSLGMSRDDLARCTTEMRHFLASDTAPSTRAFSRDRSVSQEPRSTMAMPSLRSRSNSGANASLPRPHSPSPATPVKSEYVEPSLAARYSLVSLNLDAVMERKEKERSKQMRRVREKRRVHQPSPSPARSISLDSFMNTRDHARVPSPEPRRGSPEASRQLEESHHTPPHLRYYRVYEDHQPIHGHPTQNSEAGASSSSCVGSPELTRNRTFPTSSLPPVTPKRQSSYYRTTLPQSSPHRDAEASSSPVRIVNIVTSPAPMGSPPDESEYSSLPFKLPPGPYSPTKPTHSYAALIGQAILASPDHRLTLQEIYEYITIVYPHFKRGGGEQTWMNSIRHVLSTTAVFRKVSREVRDDNVRGGEAVVGKTKGRTLWAIWDDDLDCFKNGGFDKRFCKDMVNTSGKSKKRGAEDTCANSKHAKRARQLESGSASTSSSRAEMAHPQVVPISHTNPLFPPVPNRHSYATHQPYYQQVYPSGRQHRSAEVFFPPLPDYYQQIPSHPAARSAASSSSISRSSSYLDVDDSRPVSPPLSTTSSTVPELVSRNGTSSSSSPPLEEESQLSPVLGPRVVDDDEGSVRSFSVAPSVGSFSALDDGPGDVFGDLGPSINLRETDRKGKTVQRLPPVPDSPLSRPSAKKGKAKSQLRSYSPPASIFPRAGSPLILPQTPPRKKGPSTNILQSSPLRTPLSSKGLSMSPSFDLAHYKTHLEPPAPHPLPVSVIGEQPPTNEGTSSEARAEDSERELPHTPEKRSSSGSNLGVPFLSATPQRLVFPTTPNSSSPFRLTYEATLDPYNPASVLNEELSRLGTSATFDSPVGLYGRAARGLLYESPDAASPGRLTRYW